MATAPTTVTQYQTGIAPELAPYMQNLLGQQAARMYRYDTDAQGKPILDEAGMPKVIGFQPLDTFGARTAAFQPLQNKAFGAAQNLGYDPTTQAAAKNIGELSRQAAQSTYSAAPAWSQFNRPQEYKPTDFTTSQVRPQNLTQFQMNPAERVSTQSFAQPGAAGAYMSPYMQNVVDIQQREARRASQIAGQGQQAEAVARGAFGGSRDAVMRAERERNLATQLGDIQATGLQTAYSQGQQQFNQEQQARLAAQQANQQAGVTVGGQNLAAQLGIQQLGAGQNLQAQLANQQQGMTAQQLEEQSRQYAATQGMNTAQLAAQYGLSAQQLNEQSRQYGAGLGLQGLQTGLSGYGQMAGIGQNLYNQNVSNITLQSQLGTQQQQQEQNKTNVAYQDYLARQAYPQQQMDVMASYIRGTPLSTTGASQYNAAPSTVSQITGLGMAGAGAYGMYNSMNPQQKPPGSFKKGGSVKSKKSAPAGGLEALALSKLG